jgi:hypothetical protein
MLTVTSIKKREVGLAGLISINFMNRGKIIYVCVLTHKAMRELTVLLFGIVCLAAMVSQSSCGKESSTPPNLSFSTDTTRYISRDTTLFRGATFNVGIQASKTGTEGLLTSLSISRSHNGAADSVIQQSNFVTQSFFQFYTYKAPDSADADRYTFTIAEQDGLTNSIALTVTGK